MSGTISSAKPTSLLDSFLATFRLGQQTDVILLLSLILLILRAPKDWYIQIPVIILGIVGIIHQPVRRDPFLWFLLFLFNIAGCYFNWFSTDNHKYLMAYWCLAISCALATAHPAKTIASNARYLIGLCFLFAVLWKCISVDYIDGRFFHHTLLFDGRFRNVATWVGSMDDDHFRQNRKAMRQLFNDDSDKAQEVTFQDTQSLRSFATFMTWWTVTIELAVAVSFLIPSGMVLFKYRDWILLAFIASTYSVATVIGFGWLLTIMGIAQADRRFRWLPLAYVGVFLLLELYLSPWPDFVNWIIDKA